MKRVLIVVVLGILALGGYAGYWLWDTISRVVSEDPTVWEHAIQAFEREDREQPPPESPVLFVGSSSIRFWDSLADDMAPLVTLRRGLGGYKVGDVIYYADRIIATYDPRAIVIFVGSNDLGAGFGNVPKTPEEALRLTRDLVSKIRASQPDVPIYWLAVKPTSRDPIRWERGQVLNRRVAEWAASEPGLHFVDANERLVAPDGSADARYLMFDGIHLNDEGYGGWAPPIRQRLVSDVGP